MTSAHSKTDQHLERRIEIEARLKARAAGWTEGQPGYAEALEAARKFSRRKLTFDWTSPKVGIPINWDAKRTGDIPPEPEIC